MALAISLGLPASNAVEIDNTLSVISAIILGPELKGEVLESNDNLVIGRTNDCPMLNVHRNIRYEQTTGTPAHCQAFCQSAVESLNPMYKMRYTKRMCTGNPHCEYIIELMNSPLEGRHQMQVCKSAARGWMHAVIQSIVNRL